MSTTSRRNIYISETILNNFKPICVNLLIYLLTKRTCLVIKKNPENVTYLFNKKKVNHYTSYCGVLTEEMIRRINIITIQTKWLTIYWIGLLTMYHYRLVVGMKNSFEIPKE